MDAKDPAPDSARYRTLALVLAVACAVLAAAVLALILRAPSSSPQQPSTRLPDAPSAEDPADRATSPQRRSSPLASAVNRAEIDTAPGMYRVDGQIHLEAQIAVRRAAEEDAAVVAEIPAGTTVDLVARRSGWTLVSWPNDRGGVLIGWVVIPQGDAGSILRRDR